MFWGFLSSKRLKCMSANTGLYVWRENYSIGVHQIRNNISRRPKYATEKIRLLLSTSSRLKRNIWYYAYKDLYRV